ncbi:hypothetical protein C8R44DRAFT_736283 [Mycena epipterygia]|nr:hypothetical protein C8R44DRAFT_736283 [Mycena epipterygia]
MQLSGFFILLSLVALSSSSPVSKDMELAKRDCDQVCGLAFESCTQNGGSDPRDGNYAELLGPRTGVHYSLRALRSSSRGSHIRRALLRMASGIASSAFFATRKGREERYSFGTLGEVGDLENIYYFWCG